MYHQTLHRVACSPIETGASKEILKRPPRRLRGPQPLWHSNIAATTRSVNVLWRHEKEELSMCTMSNSATMITKLSYPTTSCCFRSLSRGHPHHLRTRIRPTTSALLGTFRPSCTYFRFPFFDFRLGFFLFPRFFAFFAFSSESAASLSSTLLLPLS